MRRIKRGYRIEPGNCVYSKGTFFLKLRARVPQNINKPTSHSPKANKILFKNNHTNISLIIIPVLHHTIPLLLWNKKGKNFISAAVLRIRILIQKKISIYTRRRKKKRRKKEMEDFHDEWSLPLKLKIHFYTAARSVKLNPLRLWISGAVIIFAFRETRVAIRFKYLRDDKCNCRYVETPSYRMWVRS